ncbi:DUF2953 domain-containing protein [Thermobrachium celere]|uniref:DUF2953 domain-containing protein n=1 Tax=Thermobrachium celere DSM 8682 TaxID=941824 RepID=R7RS18_9CLOT|nr:DUF2953 domain-containing protein [Thermobrachium celere]CDF58181.1 hypothetical protein TCEL_00227 [Thermobrachium celere DSM 8682]
MIYIVILLLILILLLPIKISFIYEKQTLKIILFKYWVINLNKKNKTNKVKDRKNKKNKLDASALLKNKNLILENLQFIIKRIKFDVELSLNIASNDAFNTAMLYGFANTIIYSLISALSNKYKVYPKIDISCDFNKTKTSLYLRLTLSINLLLTILFLVKISSTYIKIKKGSVINVRTSNRIINENNNG